MNNNVNTVLGHLEEDLKKLQSAREQVEKVIESNSEFAKAANDLINITKSLIAEMKIATESVIEQFSDKLSESSNTLDTIQQQSVANIKEKIAEIHTLSQNAIGNAEAKVVEISKITSKSIGDFQAQAFAAVKDTSKLSRDSIDEIKTVAESSIEEVSNIATTAIDQQKMENLKVLNQILETHNQIKQLIGQLLDLNLPKTLEAINNNLEQVLTQFESMKKMQIWTLIGVGVALAMIVVFKFFV